MRLPRVVWRVMLIVCGLALCGATPSARQVPPAGAPVASAQGYSFPSGAGLLFFYVRPDRTAEFENVVKRLSEVLEKSADPVRKQQAAGWRVFKSVEAPRDSVIYVFVLNPAVVGTDYDPVKVLSEGLPTEAHTLYETLKSATVRIERMGLGRLR
jgi:hypothetical protein